MQKIIDWYRNSLDEQLLFILIMTLLNSIIPIYRFFLHRPIFLAFALPPCIAYGFLQGLVILLTLTLPRKIQIGWKMLISFLVVFSLVLNLGLLFKFGECFNTAFVNLMMATTYAECVDFLQQYRLPCLLVIGIILGSMIVCYFCFRKEYHLLSKSVGLFGKCLSTRSRTLIVDVFLLMSFSSTFLSFWYLSPHFSLLRAHFCDLFPNLKIQEPVRMRHLVV